MLHWLANERQGPFPCSVPLVLRARLHIFPTKNHTFYIEDLFESFLSEATIIYGHEAHHLELGKNYIYIKENFFKFILGVDIFTSTSICDKFITII